MYRAVVVLSLIVASGHARAEFAQTVEQCLATDNNCEYGTSDNCQPSVPFTDTLFSKKQIVDQAHQQLYMCDQNAPWIETCYKPRIEPILDQLDLPVLIKKVRNIEARWSNLPYEYLKDGPKCASTVNSEEVNEIKFWCANLRRDCYTQTERVAPMLECFGKMDEWLYYAEFRKYRHDLRAQHDFECHQKYDHPPPVAAKPPAPQAYTGTDASTASGSPNHVPRTNGADQASQDEEQGREAKRLREQESTAEGVQRAEKEIEAGNEATNNVVNAEAAGIAGVAQAMGKGSSASDKTTQLVRFTVGLTWAMMPIYENDPAGDNGSTNSGANSHEFWACGASPRISLEYWPVRYPHFGLGGEGDLLLGGMIGIATSSIGEASIRMQGYAGWDSSVSLVFKLGAGGRGGYLSGNNPITGASSDDNESYGYTEYGGGVHFCTTSGDSGYCDSDFNVWLSKQKSASFAGKIGNGIVLEADYITRHSLQLLVQIAPSMPITNSIAYQGSGAQSGFYGVLGLLFSMDNYF